MGVMDRLKSETAEHHARAEGKALQRAMVSGGLGAPVLADFLGQMFLVHSALEAEIERYRTAEPMLAVVPDEQRHSRRLAEDLAHFRRDPKAVNPMPSTDRLIEAIVATGGTTPAALLGLHYVLEGSMNGNRYIAMALRRTLGLAPGHGDRYLDPYGDQQRPKWIAFRAQVDALPWTAAKSDAAVTAARRMFDGVAEISDEVWARKA
jgi:heme oxygenase